MKIAAQPKGLEVAPSHLVPNEQSIYDDQAKSMEPACSISLTSGVPSFAFCQIVSS